FGFGSRRNNHITASSAGNGTLDQQQIIFGVDLDDLQILDGRALGAHVARHLLALPDTTRSLVLADGARRAMRQRVTVRCILHAEMVTLDYALEALALGSAGHIDHLPFHKG